MKAEPYTFEVVNVNSGKLLKLIESLKLWAKVTSSPSDEELKEAAESWWPDSIRWDITGMGIKASLEFKHDARVLTATIHDSPRIFTPQMFKQRVLQGLGVEENG